MTGTITTEQRGRADLGVISARRPGLFGAAILWIMLFHSSLEIAWEPLHLIKATGYAGVDVFLFLSGIGLFYSMEKDPSPVRFYKKRAVRVLLPYLLVAVVWECARWVTGACTGAEAAENVLLISYWRRGYPAYWFIAAIVVFYLIYPALYPAVKGRKYGVWAALLALAFGAAWLLYQNQGLFYRISGFVFRIPVFLMGCFLAPFVKEGRPAFRTVPAAIGCAGIALVCWYLWIGCEPWFLRMYLFLPLSMALVLLGALGLSRLPAGSPPERCLLWLGDMTLELYLVHEKILAVLQKVLLPGLAGTWTVNLLAFALAVAAAWCLRKLCTAIAKRIL